MGEHQTHLSGVYWRQLLVTVGIVLLTLLLLGAGVFSLGYRYVRTMKIRELRNQASMMSRLARPYLIGAETSLSMGVWTEPVSPEESSGQMGIHKLAEFAAAVSEIQFLVCDREGTILLATVPAPEAEGLSVPERLTQEIEAGASPATWDDFDGIYPVLCLTVGVPVYYGTDYGGMAGSAAQSDSWALVDEREEQIVGAVYAVSSASIREQWQGFVILFLSMGCVVLLIAILVSSLSAAHMVTPLRRMVLTTRRYAEGDFTLRMDAENRDDEIGELAAAFNQMAEFLQRQEAQRRELIGNVSHDMKTPLTTIAGYTDGILDGTIPPESQHHYLEIIAEESRRLSRLVRRMLDVSQFQAMEPPKGDTRFDLCECMRRVLISLESRITARGLDVDAEIPWEAISVFGDRDMITQVLYNLLDNAVKFARPGSSLQLGAALRRDGKADVWVRNEGDTIPAEELPKLFERFHKGDASRSADKDGVGLGLYIVKTILDQHREKIHVTSENGVTTFSFSLRTRREGRQNGTG